MRVGKYGVCKRNVECSREYKRRWNEVNLESKLKSQRNWREANPEKVQDYFKDWYGKWQESVRERQRQTYRENAHDELTYLVWSPGLRLHKIGITVNLTKRLAALRTGCPDVVLVTTFPYGRTLEKWLHKHFRLTRVNYTEWFSDVTEVDVKNAVIEYERGLR